MANTEAKVVDRKEAATILGVGSFHMGELIRKGKFPGAYKEAIEGRKTQKWWIPLDEVEAYAATRQSGVGKRADGRTKFTIYLTPEELVQAQEALSNALEGWDVSSLLVRANPPKAK